MAEFPQWTRDDNKRFESLLVQFPEDSPFFLQEIASRLQKPVAEVEYYYNLLLHDLALIESGQVDLPTYPEDYYKPVTEPSLLKTNDKERKRGIPWTEKEHGLFLEGLDKYGKGDWKSISREYVKTRNPTQVASHAQKFYLRQNLGSEERKRSSIHDMTHGNANNVTVPGSNLESKGQQPHFGDDQTPPEYYPSHAGNFGNFSDFGEVYRGNF